MGGESGASVRALTEAGAEGALGAARRKRLLERVPDSKPAVR